MLNSKHFAALIRCALFLDPLDERMPNKMRVGKSRIAINLFLEWKNDEHFVHHSFQLFDARPMPCPYLRTDIINHPNAAPLCLARKANIEARIINKQDSIGSTFFQNTDHLAK